MGEPMSLISPDERDGYLDSEIKHCCMLTVLLCYHIHCSYALFAFLPMSSQEDMRPCGVRLLEWSVCSGTLALRRRTRMS